MRGAMARNARRRRSLYVGPSQQGQPARSRCGRARTVISCGGAEGQRVAASPGTRRDGSGTVQAGIDHSVYK